MKHLPKKRLAQVQSKQAEYHKTQQVRRESVDELQRLVDYYRESNDWYKNHAETYQNKYLKAVSYEFLLPLGFIIGTAVSLAVVNHVLQLQ